MRIGIDCRTMLNPQDGERAGVGHYTKALVMHLAQQARKDTLILFFDHRMPRTEEVKTLAKRPNVKIVRFPWSEYKKYLPFGYSHVVVAQVLRSKHLDVFHSPAYIIPYQYRRPSVVTIHDLAIYKKPTWFPPKQSFSRSILVPSSIRRADRIIAVSKATARMVRSQFHVPPSRVTVIYEGCDSMPRVSKRRQQEVKKFFRIDDRFLFFIGTIEPRKNIDQLVRAFDILLEHYPRYRDLQLVIAGTKGWRHQQTFRTIARARWSGRIRVIGYITAEEKAALLQSCLFFTFPSLWEGFGLPVLEAARLGVPVLTSRASSLPEVAGPGALYVKPDSIQSIQQGMRTLLGSSRKRATLGRRGKEHAKQFSWKECARKTYEVYRAVARSVDHSSV